jgi:hypothetical protein
MRQLRAVASDGLDGTSFHGFFALDFFFRSRRLFIDEGKTAVVISGEVVRRSLAAKIAIDALVINIVFAHYVVRVSVANVSHKWIVKKLFSYMRRATSNIKPHLVSGPSSTRF